METHQVNSSIIRRIGYDAKTAVLEIEFKRGDVRRYINIPPAIYNGLKAASSVGKYFLTEIKGNYEYE